MGGLKLHPRTMKVQSAEAALRTYLLAFQHDRNLTDLEMAVIITDCQRRALIGPLRAERHPDDPDKKADEA